MSWFNSIHDFILKHGWILQTFLIILLTTAIHALSANIFKRFKPHVKFSKNHIEDAIWFAIRKPIGFLIWILGITYAADVVRAYAEQNLALFQATTSVRALGITICVAWGLIRFIRRMEHNIIINNSSKGEFDKTAINAIGQILRASVVITSVLIALSILGVPISSVIAFGGFGGIAVGFAAKDTLANFFGGLMIYLDKPFKVGDWVRSPDREIEGTVEYIGWRLTCIRTFDQRPLYVPNAIFSTVSVENPSRMSNRRIKMTIGLRYEDATKMRDILTEIETMLRHHPEIDQQQTLIVNLINFGQSSLDFMVYTFTKTTNWVKFQAVQQEVLLTIIDIITAHGAECAFPSRTLYIPDHLKIAEQPVMNVEGQIQHEHS
ncbi:MAG: mechanosensitive ion channel family protein [Legionellales bacterium]|nr:mechanosensitive ion channel family protein [Legionellales bacterium]